MSLSPYSSFCSHCHINPHPTVWAHTIRSPHSTTWSHTEHSQAHSFIWSHSCHSLGDAGDLRNAPFPRQSRHSTESSERPPGIYPIVKVQTLRPRKARMGTRTPMGGATLVENEYGSSSTANATTHRLRLSNLSRHSLAILASLRFRNHTVALDLTVTEVAQSGLVSLRYKPTHSPFGPSHALVHILLADLTRFLVHTPHIGHTPALAHTLRLDLTLLSVHTFRIGLINFVVHTFTLGPTPSTVHTPSIGLTRTLVHPILSPSAKVTHHPPKAEER